LVSSAVVGAQPPGQRGQQGIRQLEGSVRLEPSAGQSTEHRVHLDHRRRLVDGRVERAVHRDEIALADELVEFDIVHMAAGAGLRRVQHQEQMVVVTMDLGHLIPIRRIPNRERMEPEDRPQRLLGLLVPHRYVDPDQPVGAGQQGGQLGSVT